MRGFVFSLVFIVVFSALLSSIPAGFQGTGEAPETVIPIDPSLVTGFSENENYTTSSFSPSGPLYRYDYTLGSKDWYCITDNTTYFGVAAKILIFGFLWLGHIDICSFVTPDGENRGVILYWSMIEEDAEDGAIRYSLNLASGDSGGAFVIYWNSTEYSDPEDAWDNDELYLLHGIGFSNMATSNIGALLVSLLLLQLPEVPFLVNIFLAVPIWACIVYVLWFVIKEMIPFLG